MHDPHDIERLADFGTKTLVMRLGTGNDDHSHRMHEAYVAGKSDIAGVAARRKARCHSSSTTSEKMDRCSDCSLACAASRSSTCLRSKKVSMKAWGSSNSSWTRGLRGPASHLAYGTGNPAFFLLNTSLGRTAANALLSTRFVCHPLTFRSGGSVAANSRTL